MKKCSKCGLVKPLDCFHLNKVEKDGRHVYCKQCRLKTASDFNKSKVKKQKEKMKLWRKCHPGEIVRSLLIVGNMIQKRKQEYNRFYRQANIKRLKENNKNWAKKNMFKIREANNRYKKAHPDKVKEHDRNYRITLKGKLNRCMATGIGLSLHGNKKGRHWETLVGYTVVDLKKYLTRSIPRGYSWEDYRTGKLNLHIDHIIPIAKHNFKKPEDLDFQRCWALKNLRLLPAKENMSKSSKLTQSFQPSLIF